MGVSIFNTGYDLQDQIDAAESAIAIVSIGSTHAAITSGQYVYVREHGTLAEGLYRATANIAANGTLSSSNVTAVSGGGLNALNSNTAYNTLSFSALADLKTFLGNMAVGKTSTMLLSGEAANAVCGSTYICSCKVCKIESDFADISWIRGNNAVGSTRYQKSSQTFYVNDLNSNSVSKKAEIPANSNANNYTENGIYTIGEGNSTSIANLATTGASELVVFTSTAYTVQTQYVLGDGSTPIISFQRYFRNNIWSGWEQVASNRKFAWLTLSSEVTTGTIPNTAFEAICYVFKTGTSNIIPVTIDLGKTGFYRAGQWITAQLGFAATVEYNATTRVVSLSQLFVDGANETSNAKMKITYR